MPSLDFRANSITVVMAVRWGCRHSGLTVDTAEYKPYLKGEAHKEVEKRFQEQILLLLISGLKIAEKEMQLRSNPLQYSY